MSDLRTNGEGPTPRGPLRRDRRSKAVAGVCGGLGRHLGIDPVIFRILFVVFSFVGGLGLLAYAAAWLFVPQEGTEHAEAHRMLTGNSPWLAALVAVGLGLGVIAAVSALSNGLSGMWPMWLIGASVFGLLVWRGDIKLSGSPGAGLRERPPTWWQQPVGEGGSEGSEGPDGPDEGGLSQTPAEGVEETEPRDAVPPQYGAQAGPFSAQTGPVRAQGGPFGAFAASVASVASASSEVLGAGRAAAFGAGEAKALRPRRRGYGGLVLASLLAVSGVLGVLNAAGAISLTWLSGGAMVLLLLGAGMVIGGLFGKTTGLVPVGLVLAIPLILLSALGVPLHGTIGDENWTPDSAAAAVAQPAYQVGIGDGSLDLTDAAPGAGRILQLNAQVGIGDLQVIVPPDVGVRVHVHDGVGSVEEPGTGSTPAVPAVPGAPGSKSTSSAAGNQGGTGTTDGSAWNVNENFTIPAATADSQGTIILNLNVGVGDVDVEVGQ